MARALRRLATAAAAAVVAAASVQAASSSPVGAGQAAAMLGSLLSAPAAAAGAMRQMADGAQYAQTVDEDELGSGFWTELPTEDELLPTPTPAASSAPDSTPQETPAAPPEGSMPIAEAHYGKGEGDLYIPCGAGTIKNLTDLPAAEVAAEVGQPLPFAIELNSSEPQVLIMHTHATETYQLHDDLWYDPAFNARSTDNALNMTAVGAVIAGVLNDAGIHTVQDTTLHDYPSYTGAYERSNATVRHWLEEYPSIKVVLDVHRDAIEYEDGTRVKPVAEIGGLKAAQVMIICGADNGGNLPNFKQNLRFAAAWQDKIETMFPGLARPVLFDYRYYNQDLTTGSLLIEMGGHGNCLEEAKYSGQLVAQALAALFGAG